MLATRKRVLGDEHPKTLRTAGNLAITLCDQGKHVKAEALYRKVLAAQKRVLGDEHPDTLVTAGNLANALRDQGKHAETEPHTLAATFAPWATGTKVVVHGLVNAAELNGRAGTILRWMASKGRYKVDLDGRSNSIKPTNLKLAPTAS